MSASARLAASVGTRLSVSFGNALLQTCRRSGGDETARERDWLIPSIVLTLLSASYALIMIPDYAGISLPSRSCLCG